MACIKSDKYGVNADSPQYIQFRYTYARYEAAVTSLPNNV